MQRYLIRFCLIGLFSIGSLVAETLPDLIRQALCTHPALKAEAAYLHAFYGQLQEAQGAFYPSLYLDGGASQEELNIRSDQYLFGHITLEWNLFRGGADCAHWGADQQARIQQQMTLEKTAQEVAAEVCYAYIDLRDHIVKQELQNQFEAFLTKLEPLSKRKQEAGLEPLLNGKELLFALSVLRVERAQCLVERTAALDRLRRLVGDSSLSEESLEETLAFEAAPKRCEDFYSLAFSCRPELCSKSAEIAFCRCRLKEAQAGCWPTVDFVASWGKEDEQLGDRGVGTRALLVGRLPLYQGGRASGRILASEAKLDATIESAQQLKLEIELEVLKACSELQALETGRQMTEESLAGTEKYLEELLEGYLHGVLSLGDIVGKVELFYRMQQEMLTYQAHYSKSWVELARATGTICKLIDGLETLHNTLFQLQD